MALKCGAIALAVCLVKNPTHTSWQLQMIQQGDAMLFLSLLASSDLATDNNMHHIQQGVR